MGLTWGNIAKIVGVSLSMLMVLVRWFYLSQALSRTEVGDVASFLQGRECGQKRTLSEADEQGVDRLFLPAVAPEHNPDELIKWDLKTHLRQAASIKDYSILRRLSKQFIKKLQASSYFVRTYFEHAHTR